MWWNVILFLLFEKLWTKNYITLLFFKIISLIFNIVTCWSSHNPLVVQLKASLQGGCLHNCIQICSVLWCNIHSLATLLGTPLQLLINTNRQSANHTAAAESISACRYVEDNLIMCWTSEWGWKVTLATLSVGLVVGARLAGLGYFRSCWFTAIFKHNHLNWEISRYWRNPSQPVPSSDTGRSL